MTDNEIVKAFDILDKFEFFGGQRAGRELWFNKPSDIQDKDIGGFLRDIDFLKQFINRQKAEIEYHRKTIAQNAQIALDVTVEEIEKAKAKAVKEVLERFKSLLVEASSIGYGLDDKRDAVAVAEWVADRLVKEFTEGDKDGREKILLAQAEEGLL